MYKYCAFAKRAAGFLILGMGKKRILNSLQHRGNQTIHILCIFILILFMQRFTKHSDECTTLVRAFSRNSLAVVMNADDYRFFDILT